MSEHDCIGCEQHDDADAAKCPRSHRECGHHCNHAYTHDACDWCGQEWGDEGEPAR